MDKSRVRQSGPGSADFVVALLTIKGKMCPHNPKIRSYTQSTVPSCLAFFYQDSAVILLLKTSALCKACYDKAVPNGYMIHVCPIQPSVDGKSSAEEDRVQWWQFKTLGFESSAAIDIIRLPLKMSSEEHKALQPFLGQARPFYLPILHTLGKMSLKSLIDTDNTIASTHGIPLFGVSGEVARYPNNKSGTSTTTVTSSGDPANDSRYDSNHSAKKNHNKKSAATQGSSKPLPRPQHVNSNSSSVRTTVPQSNPTSMLRTLMNPAPSQQRSIARTAAASKDLGAGTLLTEPDDGGRDRRIIQSTVSETLQKPALVLPETTSRVAPQHSQHYHIRPSDRLTQPVGLRPTTESHQAHHMLINNFDFISHEATAIGTQGPDTNATSQLSLREGHEPRTTTGQLNTYIPTTAAQSQGPRLDLASQHRLLKSEGLTTQRQGPITSAGISTSLAHAQVSRKMEFAPPVQARGFLNATDPKMFGHDLNASQLHGTETPQEHVRVKSPKTPFQSRNMSSDGPTRGTIGMTTPSLPLYMSFLPNNRWDVEWKPSMAESGSTSHPVHRHLPDQLTVSQMDNMRPQPIERIASSHHNLSEEIWGTNPQGQTSIGDPNKIDSIKSVSMRPDFSLIETRSDPVQAGIRTLQLGSDLIQPGSQPGQPESRIICPGSDPIQPRDDPVQSPRFLLQPLKPVQPHSPQFDPVQTLCMRPNVNDLRESKDATAQDIGSVTATRSGKECSVTGGNSDERSISDATNLNIDPTQARVNKMLVEDDCKEYHVSVEPFASSPKQDGIEAGNPFDTSIVANSESKFESELGKRDHHFKYGDRTRNPGGDSEDETQFDVGQCIRINDSRDKEHNDWNSGEIHQSGKGGKHYINDVTESFDDSGMESEDRDQTEKYDHEKYSNEGHENNDRGDLDGDYQGNRESINNHKTDHDESHENDHNESNWNDYKQNYGSIYGEEYKKIYGENHGNIYNEDDWDDYREDCGIEYHQDPGNNSDADHSKDSHNTKVDTTETSIV